MTTDATKSTTLEHLFDVELAYRDDIETVVGEEDREGVIIGSGNGTVRGPKIRGSIQWSFYAAECAYLLTRVGAEPSAEQHLCKTNPGGIIETDDGALIRFDAKGYGFRGPDPAYPHMWRLTMALQFATEDERYQWLNTTLGIWEGEFDERVGQARYRAYAAVNRFSE